MLSSVGFWGVVGGAVAAVTLAVTGWTVMREVAMHDTVPPIVVGKEVMASALPSLTAKQQDMARDQAVADSRVRQLIGQRKFTVMWAQPWMTATGDLRGEIVRLELKRSTRLRGRWMNVEYDCSEASDPPYTTAVYAATADRVHYVQVLVDLLTRRVAAIQPDPQAQLTTVGRFGSNTPHTTC